MHEEDFEMAHMKMEPAAPRSGRSEDYEVDGDSEGDASFNRQERQGREGREGREAREAAAESAVGYHDFIAFTSEAERRKRLEVQFHTGASAQPLQQFGHHGHHRAEATGCHGGGGHGSSSPASSSSPAQPSGAALKRSNTLGSSSLLAADARQMAARLPNHRTHAAAPATDGAATQVQVQQALRQGVELLAMSMAARLEQVENKAEREMASMRREVQSQSELLRAISARLGAPTAGRLATITGGDASGSPALASSTGGRGRRPSVAPTCQSADPGS